MTQAEFKFRRGNPDVLTSIANLSNDEVFTPPEFANMMLDTLEEAWAASNNGAIIWEDSTVTFLDPFTKSGVFLREITERLTHGLEKEIPDLQERVNHILTKQVFGIAITQLTSLLARRSVYCSKWANGEHSIVTAFENPDGNIWFERTEHTWVGGKDRIIVVDENGKEVLSTTHGKCKFCGANQKDFSRDFSLETHAYSFIHSEDIKTTISEIFGQNMKFDVIIGNPPYQLSTGGTGGNGIQARPIYNLFVDQAKRLEANFMIFVTPSRWFTGGMGLEEFRANMLSDQRIRKIIDFPDSNDVFPGTQIKGGVSYFLWQNQSSGLTEVSTNDKGQLISTAFRPLLEEGADVFIRYNLGVSILKKVSQGENEGKSEGVRIPTQKSFMNFVSSIGYFGLDTRFRGNDSNSVGDVLVFRNGGFGYIPRGELNDPQNIIDAWKVFVPAAGSGSDSFPHSILGKPFLGEPGTASSWTYMYIGPFTSEAEASNVISYIQTKFFRFLVLLHKPSQHATRSVYSFVPTQDFSRAWSDQELFEKYGLSQDEIDFIDSMIKPMGDSDE